MLNHIGITINDKQEITNFYQKILGFEIVKNFQISSELSKQLFEIDNSADVVLLKRNELFLEVFICSQKTENKYNHVCLSVPNRQILIAQAKEQNYQIKIIPRDTFDLVFLTDKSGNIFEIKETVK